MCQILHLRRDQVWEWKRIQKRGEKAGKYLIKGKENFPFFVLFRAFWKGKCKSEGEKGENLFSGWSSLNSALDLNWLIGTLLGQALAAEANEHEEENTDFPQINQSGSAGSSGIFA